MTVSVAIVPTGGANLASLGYALDRLGVRAEVTADPPRLRAASRVILPGVGAAGDCMARVEAAGLVDVLRGLRQPVLGICAGMQIMFDSSEEGDAAGLGIFAGRVTRFPDRPGLPVPHMGWNELRVLERSPLFDGIGAGDFVYFVHSYAAPAGTDTVATADYGGEFTAAVSRDNFHGVQFHPERSAEVGARLLRNFVGS